MGRRWLSRALLILTVAVVSVGCGGGSPQIEVTATATQTTTGPGPAAPTSAPSSSGAAAGARSAAESLAAYMTAAEAVDTRLREAAALINAAVGPTAATIDDATARAVQAADPAVAAREIPAGLDDDLLRATLLVQDGLTTRRAAMNRAEYPDTWVVNGAAIPAPDLSELLGCLANGSAAAHRFSDDLADLSALATSSPPVTVAPPESRAAAELAVRLEDLRVGDNGCNACGVPVNTRPLPPITWKIFPPADDEDRTATDGRIGHTEFFARYEQTTGWVIDLLAC